MSFYRQSWNLDKEEGEEDFDVRNKQEQRVVMSNHDNEIMDQDQQDVIEQEDPQLPSTNGSSVGDDDDTPSDIDTSSTKEATRTTVSSSAASSRGERRLSEDLYDEQDQLSNLPEQHPSSTEQQQQQQNHSNTNSGTQQQEPPPPTSSSTATAATTDGATAGVRSSPPSPSSQKKMEDDHSPHGATTNTSLRNSSATATTIGTTIISNNNGNTRTRSGSLSSGNAGTTTAGTTTTKNKKRTSSSSSFGSIFNGGNGGTTTTTTTTTKNNTNKNKSNKISPGSLTLRKLPTNILLFPSMVIRDDPQRAMSGEGGGGGAATTESSELDISDDFANGTGLFSGRFAGGGVATSGGKPTRLSKREEEEEDDRANQQRRRQRRRRPQEPNIDDSGRNSVDVLMSSNVDYDDDLTMDGMDGGDDDDGQNTFSGSTSWIYKHIIQPYCCFLVSTSCCLSPQLRLKTQLMLSFGTVNLMTIVFVIVVSISITYLVGENVKTINQDAFETHLVRDIQATTLRYLSESLHHQYFPVDLMTILVEATQDRFQGYPYNLLSGDEDVEDYGVPFHDSISNEARYPIDMMKSHPMFFDYEIPNDIRIDNYQEHVQQNRWDSFFKNQIRSSTANAVFLMQGACDPNETNPLGAHYWPNCTIANNNITTGGVEVPVPTTGGIYRKGNDLVPLLKVLFEAKPEIQDLGIYFANGGASAVISFPAYPLSTQDGYNSTGCDWMNTPNPLDPSLGPIGTPEEISRCRPKGEWVSNRQYNPLEKDWCSQQALNPHRTFANAWPDTWNDGNWVLFLGRAVYDRETKAFLACTLVVITISAVGQTLKDSLVTSNSVLSLIQYNSEGTVVASTAEVGDEIDLESDTNTIDQFPVGISQESFQSLYNLVDYDTVEWDPETVREQYKSFSILSDGFLVAVAPIPQVPDVYDVNYKPEFFVTMSTYEEDIFQGVIDLNNEVDGHVKEAFQFSLAAGAIGLLVTTLMIIFMSQTLTSPLGYINDSADEIVNNIGTKTNISKQQQDADDDENDASQQIKLGSTSSPIKDDTTKSDRPDDSTSKFKGWLCSPTTELSEVLVEFHTMMGNFSGSMLAKSEKEKRIEVRNRFDLHKEFTALYASRNDPSFAYNLSVSSDGPEDERSSQPSDVAGYIHIGSNVMAGSVKASSVASNRSRTQSFDVEMKQRRCTSRLFLWTVALIVTPLLLTTITISAVAMYRVKMEFGNSIDSAKQYFADVELDALSVQAALRAEFVGGVVGVSVRDLFFLTRYFEWLLFDGIERTDSYTELKPNFVELCKTVPRNVECPAISNADRVCDCEWNDNRIETCQVYPPGVSRHSQTMSWTCQADDASWDGDRVSTSFPKVADSSNTTTWWEDPATVPGWEKGSSAAGYYTLYDRMRVSSAMPLFPVLYNYDTEKENHISHSIAFEADGLLMGYNGCRDVTASFIHWKSTESNGAAKMRPELCPVGKYGYDPRCRGWYDNGRRNALENNSYLHITSPYLFISNTIGQSATAPLVDPRTGRHVGQVLNDFYSNSISEALSLEKTSLSSGGFPILIAIQGDPEANAVIGPGYATAKDIKEISQVVLPHDHDCSTETCEENLTRFQKIVESMKRGETNSDSFRRSMADGGMQTVHISYAPSKVKSIHAVNSSNFARGIDVSEYMIYSLGLCETEDGLFEPFDRIEGDMNEQIRREVAILAVGIVFAAAFVVYVSYLVAASITEPMQYLRDLIRRINRSDFGGDPPRIEHSSGPREIKNVSDTVAVLYKIVRAANEFFFAGELELACVVLLDALRLFKSLGNQKAVAVASNNLGNTLLAIYRESKEMGLEKHCRLTRKEIISKGIAHFHRAIKLGEKAYDEFYNSEGWTPNCLDFMQHLSNRYFNRALFLLSVKEDHEQPDEIEKLGLRDLEIARDMDLEIIEYGEDIGFNRESRAHKLFNVYLVRAKGHNMLFEMGYPNEFMAGKGYPEDWELPERLDDCFKLVQNELKKKNSELFHDISALGRLQEVETELMKYNMLTGNSEMAAKIAVRIVMEDAVVFAETLAVALEVLIVHTNNDMDMDRKTRTRISSELLKYSKQIDKDLENVDNETRGSNLSALSEEVTSRVSQISQISAGSGPSPISLRRASTGTAWIKKRVSGLVTMEDF